MKRGFIQINKTTPVLLQIIKDFNDKGVEVENVVISSSFDNFLMGLERGDIVYVHCYVDVFSGINDLLSCLIELYDRGIYIVSIQDTDFTVTDANIKLIKDIFSLKDKLSLCKSVPEKKIIRFADVKCGRPPGSSLTNIKKVKEVLELSKSKNVTITKACKIVGCNPRTYYRYINKNPDMKK